MELKDIAQAVGLSAPFAAAAPIYALFKFIDKKASDKANEAVTAWIKGEHYKHLDLKAAVIEGFDNLYGTPLFSVRTFVRSAGLSLVAVFIVAIAFAIRARATQPIAGLIWFIVAIVPTIISDYASLFIVRICLDIRGTSLRLSILGALTGAAIAVNFVGILSIELANVLQFILIGRTNVVTIQSIVNGALEPFRELVSAPTELILSFQALLVDLWLPLLLLAGGAATGLNVFFRAVGWAQWFLSQPVRSLRCDFLVWENR
jgi:hypothetical protein